MRSPFKKPLFILLIGCYAFVAAAGNMVLLRELLNSGDSHHLLTEHQNSQPIPGSPVWTFKSPVQQIHQTDQSVHITPAGFVVHSERQAQAYHFPPFQSHYTYLECLPSKPRDPPLI